MKKLRLWSAAVVVASLFAGSQAAYANTGTNTGTDTGADTGLHLMGKPGNAIGTPAPGNPPGNSQMMNKPSSDTGIYSNTGNVYDTTRVYGPNPTGTPNAAYRMQSTTTLDPNLGKTAPYPAVNTPQPNNYGKGKYNMNGYQMQAAPNRNFNWGWLGLLGLFGLAGMRSRGRDYDDAK
ncbi:WGxxGxxG family protein [Paenibacillus sp. MBLB4367]|uniref:WGxxGxxG family protein n=1 Tax=Paenibacillus sp. MBLB4367 TaxID=3384767 RepID=UPI0039083723